MSGTSSSREVPILDKLLLPLRNNIRLPALNKVFEPKICFKTQSEICGLVNFTSWILSRAKPIEKLGALRGNSFNLRRTAYDYEIVRKLPKSYGFDPSEFCVRVVQMIEIQSGGKKCDFLDEDGQYNIFYVADCVVSMRRDFDSLNWIIAAWEFNSGSWRAGSRVFSRT